jgi:hypothetical protein
MIIISHLAFQSFDFERTWWMLLQKRVVRTKFNIYIYISLTLTGEGSVKISCVIHIWQPKSYQIPNSLGNRKDPHNIDHYQITQYVNLNNPKGASFKENHLMTTTRDALRTTSICRFLIVGNIFRLEACMNSLVKVPPYSKLNFQGKKFFTQNWCNITLKFRIFLTMIIEEWLFHVVCTIFFGAIILRWYTRYIFLLASDIFFIDWTVCMSDNLTERLQILGPAHIICITVREKRIICCQIFGDLLLKSAFERIFNVIIRIHQSKKNRQHNDQKEKGQTTIYKTYTYN